MVQCVSAVVVAALAGCPAEHIMSQAKAAPSSSARWWYGTIEVVEWQGL
jgi:hypothetical protein